MKTWGKVLLTMSAQVFVTVVLCLLVFAYLWVNNNAQQTDLSPEERQVAEKVASKVEVYAYPIVIGVVLAVSALGFVSLRRMRKREENND